MHIKRRISIYFTMFLLTLVSVSAQGRSVGSALRQVMDIFSSLYRSVPSFFNAIVYIAILGYALEMSAKRVKGLGENSGKVSRVVALALGVSLAVFEARQGSNYLLAFGPYAFLLIMFIFGITIYHGLTGLSIESKRAIGFAYFFIFTVAQGAVPEYMNYIDREIPLLSAILWITYLISIFLMLWAVFSLLSGTVSAAAGLVKGKPAGHDHGAGAQDHKKGKEDHEADDHDKKDSLDPHKPEKPATTPQTPQIPPEVTANINHDLTQLQNTLSAYVAAANGPYLTHSNQILHDHAANPTTPIPQALEQQRNDAYRQMQQLRQEMEQPMGRLTAYRGLLNAQQAQAYIQLLSLMTSITNYVDLNLITKYFTQYHASPPNGTPLTPIPPGQPQQAQPGPGAAHP